MGHSSYDDYSRSLRSTVLGYATKGADEIFTQNKVRRIHESMSPYGIDKRECRDSSHHPNSFPVIISLDVTGSMGKIPHELVKDGLPKIMGRITQNGLDDAAVLFLAVGDHECDNYPLQVGQFESGDLELDTWLTRTYIEGAGGGNAGESYLLAWYFAAHHTVSDRFEKRGKKGLLFTIGDEPCLSSLPINVRKTLMGNTARGQVTSYKDLFEEASKTYDIYHIHVLQGSAGQRSLSFWKDLLGQNCVPVEDFTKVASTIADICVRHADVKSIDVTPKNKDASSKKTEDPVKEEIVVL